MRSYEAGIYDIYDDGGRLLKELVPDQANLPEFVKQASTLGQGGNSNLFALVMVDDGKVLQKFATADSGNTWLSTLYFSRTKDRLPIEAQKIAAANLIEACDAFELVIPEFLFDVAEGPPDTNLVDVTGLRPPSIVKQASVVMEAAERNDEVHYAIERADGTRYFPIGDGRSVSTAIEYFDREHRNFVPRERREFAVKVAAQAAKGCLPISDAILKYAGEDFNVKLDGFLAIRYTHLQHEEAEIRDELVKLGADARTSTPLQVAQALEAFDEKTGLSAMWDRDIPDPYLTVFGLLKEAKGVEPTGETFHIGPDAVTSDELNRLADRGKAELIQHFGETFANGFARNPVSVFKSLPLPEKRTVARMAASADTAWG